MKKTCTKCGYTGENVWQDNKYFCASCGSEIDVTQKDSDIINTSSVQTGISVTCPICQNSTNNSFRNGKYVCSLCGTSFDYNQEANQPRPNNSQQSGVNSNYWAQLEQQKNKNLIWGIVWLIFFFPVSIYFFYKVYQISQEQSRLL